MKAERPYPQIAITPKGEEALTGGHPWVYEGEVTSVTGSPADGDLVDVVSRRGSWLGAGFYNSRSLIRVRLLSRNANDRFDADFWARRAGGWNVDSNAESVTYGESLVIKSANYYNHDRSEGVLTKNQIDLTAYRTLQAICKADGGTSPALAVYTGSNAVASGAIGAELNVVTIDISALSGLHYIGFSARHAAYASVTYTATEIKLVK